MTNDLEDRLRRDLPRLADAIVDAPGAATPGAVSTLTRATDAPAGSIPSYADNVVPIHEHPRRRGVILIAAAVAIVVLLIGGAVALTSRDSSSTNDFAAGPILNGAVPGTWTDIAPAPFAGAEDAAAVWTGSEVLLFGGHRTINGVTNAELISAAYDPATNTWRDLADPPGMAPVVAATWAGDVAVVVSKNSGAVYDPAADSWRELPTLFVEDAPVNQLAQPVWTGEELLLIDVQYGDGGSGVQLNARRLDLENWRWIQPSSFFGASGLPLDSNAVDGPPATTWDGEVAVIDLPVIFGPWASSWAFDPASNTWSGIREQPAPNGPTEPPPSASTSITTAGGKTYRVVQTSGLPSYGNLSVWERDGFEWIARSEVLTDIMEPGGGLRAVGTDQEIVVLGFTGRDEQPLEFDLESGSWRESMSAFEPSWIGRATTPAGSQVFEWGGFEDMGPAADTFTPTNTGRLWTPSNP